MVSLHSTFWPSIKHDVFLSQAGRVHRITGWLMFNFVLDSTVQESDLDVFVLQLHKRTWRLNARRYFPGPLLYRAILFGRPFFFYDRMMQMGGLSAVRRFCTPKFWRDNLQIVFDLCLVWFNRRGAELSFMVFHYFFNSLRFTFEQFRVLELLSLDLYLTQLVNVCLNVMHWQRLVICLLFTWRNHWGIPCQKRGRQETTAKDKLVKIARRVSHQLFQVTCHSYDWRFLHFFLGKERFGQSWPHWVDLLVNIVLQSFLRNFCVQMRLVNFVTPVFCFDLVHPLLKNRILTEKWCFACVLVQFLFALVSALTS